MIPDTAASPKPSRDDCSALFVRAFHGDGDAATQLYRNCIPGLQSRLGARMLWSDAEDIAHDALLLAFRHGARFKPNHSFRAWLHTIASRLASNHGRNESRRRSREIAFVNLEGTGRMDGSELDARRSRILAQCLAHLPENEKRLLVLRYSENRTPTEIADQTGSSRAAISARLHRTCWKLRAKALGALLERQGTRTPCS